MTGRRLATRAELVAAIGKRPAGADLKTIGFLDGHCLQFLDHTRLLVLGTTGADGRPRTLARGATAAHSREIVQFSADDAAAVTEAGIDDGAPAGVLALVPGHGETLRLNGTLRVDAGGARLDVTEAFLHCAKAIIRSKLWTAPLTAFGAGDDGSTAGLLARSPFIALSSVDGGGAADVSPKGDPAGFVTVLDDEHIAIPDRPGNRRTDTMYNLLTCPRLGVLALVPGDDRVLEVRGEAHITDDNAVVGPMAVEGKTPHAAIVVRIDTAEIRSAPPVAAGLWDRSRNVAPGTLPRGSRVWTDHVRLNGSGIAGKAAKLMPERLVNAGIERDYANNLY